MDVQEFEGGHGDDSVSSAEQLRIVIDQGKMARPKIAALTTQLSLWAVLPTVQYAAKTQARAKPCTELVGKFEEKANAIYKATREIRYRSAAELDDVRAALGDAQQDVKKVHRAINDAEPVTAFLWKELDHAEHDAKSYHAERQERLAVVQRASSVLVAARKIAALPPDGDKATLCEGISLAAEVDADAAQLAADLKALAESSQKELTLDWEQAKFQAAGFDGYAGATDFLVAAAGESKIDKRKVQTAKALAEMADTAEDVARAIKTITRLLLSQ